MGSNILKIISLVLVLSLLFSFQCSKPSCLESIYNIDITAEWAPEMETYSIGDTIVLNSEIPGSLVKSSNPLLLITPLDSIEIVGGIGIHSFDTVMKVASNANDSFSRVALVGSFVAVPGNNIYFSYAELTNSYQFKAGFICRKKGLYSISVDGIGSRGYRRQKNCDPQGFVMTITNFDKHIELYKNALGLTLVNPQSLYCFRVQ